MTDSIRDFLKIFDGEYKDVTELTINRLGINKEILNVNYSDLLNFPNLEALTLVNLVLDNDAVEILFELTKLEYIYFINCELICDDEILAELNLKRICLDNSIISDAIFKREYDVVEIRHMNVDYKKIITKKLIVEKTKVNFKDINYDKLNTLVISLDQYNQNKNIIKSGVHLIVKDNVYDGVVAEYE